MSRELLQQARRFIVLSTADSPELEAQKPRLLADIDAELIKPKRKHTEAEVDEWVAAFLKCSTNGEFREEARRILGVSHG